MQVSTGASSSAQMMQLAQSLTQGNQSHTDFQAGLNQQQGQSSSNTQGSNTTNTTQTTTATAQSTNTTTTPSAVSGGMFNTLGNLNTTANLKDFSLLNSNANLLNQVNMLNHSIQTSQLVAMQPATFMQIGMVLKLFEHAELKYKQSQQLHSSLGPASAEAQKAAEESQIMLLAFFERCNRLFEQQKTIALSRFFKKGPLGENLHDENTDDEYGTVYNDVDAETDYIKRYRKLRSDMLFHYSLIS